MVTTYADDTDSLTAYYGSGRMGMLPIPAELAEAAKATVGPKIGTDGQGDIVLSAIADIRLGGHGGYLVAGAVIDSPTGCYARIRNPEKNMFAYEFRGVYADSAVVAVAAYEEGQELGRRVIDYYDYADKVALYPLRRVNGEPCAGMLADDSELTLSGRRPRSGIPGYPKVVTRLVIYRLEPGFPGDSVVPKSSYPASSSGSGGSPPIPRCRDAPNGAASR